MVRVSSSEQKASRLASARSSTAAARLEAYAKEIRACRICRDAPFAGPPLPHEPRPVLRVSSVARLLIASQAPGTRVHASGIPFTDPSGDRLRDWLGMGKDVFYDENRVAITPMGFCFPGLDASKGDLPPRRECRATWHDHLFMLMPQIELVLAIGSYAQAYHIARLEHLRAAEAGEPERPVRLPSMTELVRDWRSFAGGRPQLIPLPHPSWRNNGWLKKNPWFEADLLPHLRSEVALCLGRDSSSSSLCA
jgi:uracil-DNA glycosylase